MSVAENPENEDITNPKEYMMNRALEASLKVNAGTKESEDSFKDYVKEWEALFVGEDILQRVKSKAVKGDLKICNFRSICWKLLLGCLPEDSNLWIESTKSQRHHYEEILDKVSFDPRYTAFKDDVAINNPLSLAQENPWNQYFKDKDLKKTIQQDVIRTFPEIKFFQTREIQELMISILFSYAQQFPHLAYKQGMHELLAPIIYVLSHDNKQYLAAAEKENLDMKIHFLLNQNYIEHDAFSLFLKLMKAVEPWYSINISPNSKTPYFDHRNFLAVKLKEIHEHLLKKFDHPLYEHLEKMEIIPQIYGIRWLRLLFGREFPISELLGLWDAIFAGNETFELVDYVCVAMLISIRHLLFSADYSTCLRYLMRYPNSVELRSILNMAFSLRRANLNEGSEPVLVKNENITLPAPFKDVKQSASKAVSKHSGIAKPVKAVSNVKYSESRPKSLSLTNSFWGYSSSAAPDVLGKEKDQSSDQSSWEFVEEANYLLTRKLNTLPRARIGHVMEKKADVMDSSDASLAIENLADRTMVDKRAMAVPKVSLREMLPLSVSQHADMDVILLEVEKLRSKISELRTYNEYCSEQLSQNIEQLQNCLLGQNLIHEDKIIDSLAGLKRVRDYLKETCEVLEGDIPTILTVESCSQSDESVESKTETVSGKTESCKMDFHRSSKSSIHETLSKKLKENLMS